MYWNYMEHVSHASFSYYNIFLKVKISKNYWICLTYPHILKNFSKEMYVNLPTILSRKMKLVFF